ncbi:MAG TPA: alpha/beta-type small acid-soluble spore protein, partial [Bacillota bacterium]|nr:alpha/beta-type small acid-soluble spore protein [Bacillota bacterium]
MGPCRIQQEVSRVAQGSSSNRALVREASGMLDRFKYEVAQEIGVNPPENGYWGELS